jgi:hypothetical protein
VTTDLGTLISALHDSEINGAVSWVYDGIRTGRYSSALPSIGLPLRRYSAARGGRMVARERRQTVSYSAFAWLYPRSANDPRRPIAARR